MSASLLLSTDELAALTGRVRQSAQRRWLARNGFRFETDADGRPRVLRAQLEQRQGIRGSSRTSGPDLDALDRFG